MEERFKFTTDDGGVVTTDSPAAAIRLRHMDGYTEAEDSEAYQAPPQQPVADSELTGYDAMTVKALEAEADRRNEDRDDDAKLSKTGNKADLVATLQADDTKS